MGNLRRRLLTMISTAPLAGGFSTHPLHQKRRSVHVASKISNNNDDECCPVCAGDQACCEAAAQHNQAQSRKINPIIHTSRRNFVQFVAASGFTACSSPAYGTEYNVSPSPTMVNNNIIAVPTGSLAPFSSTRQYRTIMLSNGLQVVLVKDTQAQRSSVALTIDGAGQFSDPEELPGLAHLMEHIVLSSSKAKNNVFTQRKARRIWKSGIDKAMSDVDISNEQDFEDWLVDNEGDSNAFTAPSFVCFHFNAPREALPEGLERFAELFTLDAIETTVTKPSVIQREVGRVDSELDTTSDASRAFYWLKSNFDPSHPFARFAAGSRETLETQPNESGIDVAGNLLQFFRDYYVATRATLVVVSNDELRALDRWISPFSSVLSQKSGVFDSDIHPRFPDIVNNASSGPADEENLTIGFSESRDELVQTVILRSTDDYQVDENIQTLAIEWPLSLVYSSAPRTRHPSKQHTITASAVGFIVSQIISRRGPGSLRSLLGKFNWVPQSSLTKGVPRISFPIDVNGFQVLRMELGLTMEGFANRSAVVAAVFEGIRTSISKPLQLDLIKQCLSTAWLHGYLLAPRPPDSISLAVDALRFGVGGTGIGVQGYWHLMPSPDDHDAAYAVKNVVEDVLKRMTIENNSIVSFRASQKAIFGHSQGIVDSKISKPPIFGPWKREPITGARYLVESRTNGGSSLFKSLAWFAANFDGDALSPPFFNPLIPTKIRMPRLVVRQSNPIWGRRLLYLEDANAEESSRSTVGGGLRLTTAGAWREYPVGSSATDNNSDEISAWKLFQIPPGNDLIGLPLPVRPPEPSVEGVVVIQLLSSLPSSFTQKQLMLANLWLTSFDDEILDLSELGASAGIAYETSFNPTGLRISFRGVSQSLPSYIRRFCRRLIHHHERTLSGSTQISDGVYRKGTLELGSSAKINMLRKENVSTSSHRISEQDVANQGSYFLKCTTGGLLVTQGDIIPSEGLQLLRDVKHIFREYGKATMQFAADPEIRDLLYVPYWKPRESSPCLLPGIQLVSDSCGRVPR